MMRKGLFFSILLIVMILSACNSGGSDGEAQTVGTAVPTAPVGNFPADEPIPTDDNTASNPDAPTQSASATIRNTNPPPTATTDVWDIAFPTTFQEEYTVDVSAGQTLVVNFATNLDAPNVSQLYILVSDSTGTEVARVFVDESIVDSAEIPIETSGTHTVFVGFENLQGNYSVNYEIR